MRYLTLCALGLAPTVLATQVPVTAVDFAPAAQVKLQQEYGADEAATLRSAIESAVSRATARAPAGCTVAVTVRDVAPSHPTRRQSADNPSLDVRRTKYLGGADLAGDVRDAHQRVLTTVTYQHYARTLLLGTYSVDPWGDARLAIDGFAGKVAAACAQAPKD